MKKIPVVFTLFVILFSVIDGFAQTNDFSSNGNVILTDNANLLLNAGQIITPYGGFGKYSNLAQFSEQFDLWTPRVGATVNTDAAIAPNGTTTADKFNPVATNGYTADNSISGDVNGRTFTFSVWLKSVSGTKSVRIGVIKNGDLGVGISTQVTVTGSWQRFSVTGTGNTTSINFAAYMQNADGNTNSWYAWGAQLEESSTAGIYVGTGTNSIATAFQGLVVNSGNSVFASHVSVNGNITTKKITVTQLGWSDYVFAKDYKLRSLSSLKSFIRQNKHLPEVPTAKEVEEKGISVGDNQALLLKKIEELTLYVIEMNKKITTQNEKIGKLQQQLSNNKNKKQL